MTTETILWLGTTAIIAAGFIWTWQLVKVVKNVHRWKATVDHLHKLNGGV